MGLGIDPEKILVLYNGLRQPPSRRRRPGARRVVSVGRIDPLKDVHTHAAGGRRDAPARARTRGSCTTGR